MPGFFILRPYQQQTAPSGMTGSAAFDPKATFGLTGV
jgi:hypothetical protein